MDVRQEAREDLAAVLRWSSRLGLNEGVDNHYSVLVPGTDDRFIINPHRRQAKQDVFTENAWSPEIIIAIARRRPQMHGFCDLN